MISIPTAAQPHLHPSKEGYIKDYYFVLGALKSVKNKEQYFSCFNLLKNYKQKHEGGIIAFKMNLMLQDEFISIEHKFGIKFPEDYKKHYAN